MKKIRIVVSLIALLLAIGCSSGESEKDTAPPVILEISASSVTRATAIVAWTTDERAAGHVEYGIDDNYGERVQTDETLSISQSVGLSGLLADTVYHYRIVLWDATGNETVSADYTFRTADDLLVGAYYYPWWNDPKWREQPKGYAQTPSLGQYNSRHVEVIDQHISWATDYGIDFFPMSWWGPRWEYKGENDAWRDRATEDFFDVSDQRTPVDLSLCILYETNGRFKKGPDGFRPDTVRDDGRTNEQVLMQDFNYFVANFFDRPSYLRVNDRPIVFVADADNFRDWDSAFTAMRAEMDGKGYDVMLVGMLSCWQDPDWGKFHYYDAVTCYHMFASDPSKVSIVDSTVDHADFLDKVDERYQTWQARVAVLIPNVIPGYDDSLASSGQLVHLPRSPEFFDDYWDLARRHLDPRRAWNMVMITSFNEWHEGTQVEPAEEYSLDYLEAVMRNSRLQQ